MISLPRLRPTWPLRRTRRGVDRSSGHPPVPRPPDDQPRHAEPKPEVRGAGGCSGRVLKRARTLDEMDKPRGALDFDREILVNEPGTAAARTAAARVKTLGGEDGAAKGP